MLAAFDFDAHCRGQKASDSHCIASPLAWVSSVPPSWRGCQSALGQGFPEETAISRNQEIMPFESRI